MLRHLVNILKEKGTDGYMQCSKLQTFINDNNVLAKYTQVGITSDKEGVMSLRIFLTITKTENK